jgi:peptide/nickel transport system substrate-binding protein
MTSYRHPGLPSLAALALLLVAAGLVGSAPQVPEQEDPKGGVKKRVVVDDPDTRARPAAPEVSGTPPHVRLDELVRAAGEVSTPALKELLSRFAVPFDRLTEAKGAPTRVRPVPLRYGRDPFPKEFGIAELDAKGQPQPARGVSITDVRGVEHFEDLALAAAEQLLKQPAGAGPTEQYHAAERLLAAALRFHDYARAHPYPDGTTPIRSGKSWDPVRGTLADRLKEIRVQQLKVAVTGLDWGRAREYGGRLLAAYPKDAAVAREVAAAWVGEASELLKSRAHADLVRARELLDEADAKAGGGGEAGRKARELLTREAIRQFDLAREKRNVGDEIAARDALRRAEALDPNVPGLRDLMRELKAGYPVLYVGAREYPERMSPATARFDSERQAVALLFEGLLEAVPDTAGGVRYLPGVALAPPRLVPGGREFALRVTGPDAAGASALDAHDVVGTVKMLRARPDLWVSAGLPWLDDLPTPTTTGGVRVGFRQGHPDPRSLLTFKVLPARWLADRGKGPDDPEFAARPFGTGPYRIHANPQPSGGQPRELVFVDNPAYGRWPDRTGLPAIREIRFLELAKVTDPAAEFARDRLHILTDVPTADLDRLLSPSSPLAGKVQRYTAATNRRVHILAVNHRRPHLQNKDLRRGLSLAIDRDGILADVFRAGKPEFHRPMTGPFPPTSWATVKGPGGKGEPLGNRDLAVGKLRGYLMIPGAKAEVNLLYPDNDPQAKLACERIKAQVETLFKDSPDGKRVAVVLEPAPPRDVMVRVWDEHRYELAYIPFDYPDDWHPYGLAAFLDPDATGRSGRNCMGYLGRDSAPDADDQSLGRLLQELRAYRDFSGAIVPKVREIHDLFNSNLPFIPLWQLDRHLLVSNRVKVYVGDGPEPASPAVLDPTTLFQNVARWRLE